MSRIKAQAYVALQVILFVAILIAPKHFTNASWPAVLKNIGYYLSFPVYLTAFAMGIAALIKLGTNLSPFPKPKANAFLVSDGIFSLVRHPIYGAIILVVIAWGLFANSTPLLIYSVILWLFFEFKANFEESQLEKHFPDYARYKRSVKKFFPYLY